MRSQAVRQARGVLGAADMCEFTSLERCAAYVAARTTLAAIQRVVPGWPDGLGDRTCRAAIATVQQITAAIAHDQATAERRQHLRSALASALGVAAAIDLACTGPRADASCDDELDDLSSVAGRTIALLGMLLHASSSLGVPQRVNPPQEGTTRDQRARRK